MVRLLNVYPMISASAWIEILHILNPSLDKCVLAIEAQPLQFPRDFLHILPNPSSAGESVYLNFIQGFIQIAVLNGERKECTRFSYKLQPQT